MKFKLHGAWPCLIILAAFITACNAMSTPTPAMPIFWQATQSPLFPNEWPPTTSTVWVRYTFAYGSNPSALVDGVYVTRPLTRTEVSREGRTVAAIDLNNPLESVRTQGMVPLTLQQQAMLDRRAQVESYGLTLTVLPAAGASEAAELRAYYQLWLKFNGAFAKLIQPDHAAFFEWLN
ncbi:MAG TPA: hypothetical protein VFF59_10915 [Anaerolineae bacterium]|nr:hypothetical protein [Anaerolineae bacterium]